jgi:hypothetical protein
MFIKMFLKTSACMVILCTTLHPTKTENNSLHRRVLNNDLPNLIRCVKENHTLAEPLEERGQHGRTPLHMAVIAGHTEIVDYLLRAKVSTRACDEYKQSIFHSALYMMHKGNKKEKHFDIVKQLLKRDPALVHFYGKEQNAPLFLHDIPLFYALSQADYDLFILLLAFHTALQKETDLERLNIMPVEYRLRIIEEKGEATDEQNVLFLTKKEAGTIMKNALFFMEKSRNLDDVKAIFTTFILKNFFEPLKRIVKEMQIQYSPWRGSLYVY